MGTSVAAGVYKNKNEIPIRATTCSKCVLVAASRSGKLTPAQLRTVQKTFYRINISDGSAVFHLAGERYFFHA